MGGDEERMESDESEEWLNTIDRGGLCRVSDQTYSLFYAVEDVVRKHFTQVKAHQLTDVNKPTLIKAVEENEEVLFQWCILTADTSNENAMLLLHMITEFYITIRGFSFAASCVELYKHSAKRTLQKGKGVRKEQKCNLHHNYIAIYIVNTLNMGLIACTFL